MQQAPPIYRRGLLMIAIMLFSLTSLSAQSLELNWTTKTDGKVIAGPVADEMHIYIGNEKGVFLAIDINTGKINWQIETSGNIQAKAVLAEDLVILESANTFYALNTTDGKEIWKYSPNTPPEQFSYGGVEYLYKLDPFDDKRSSGILRDGIFYTGTSDGNILGLNAKTGALNFSQSTADNAPVRSTPFIADGQLFYGDWNGVVYCYDLNKETLIWKKNTYREKPYTTFGGIASEFTIHKGKLFFGARNHMFNVLWLEDGQKEWTYTDPDGGWLIGDPVIRHDTLYIGGSDNFAMLALDANNGRLLWKTKRTKNIYAKPIVTETWVIYGGGNSYNPKDSGEIVVLDRMSGSTLAAYETTSSVFSAPILINDEDVLFGSSDGTVYSLKIK
ncbi:MAG: PQQ-binding-like beta-propeller repeat protein [Bacteroidia bacterium]|nr:PQQ-binding-like beta-propeller repeat protein [Bacteroidia bacterium]